MSADDGSPTADGVLLPQSNSSEGVVQGELQAGEKTSTG